MSKNIYKVQECDYCGDLNKIVRPTPFMADIPAMMCKNCWDMTREEYMNSNGECIPSFEDGPGFKDMKEVEVKEIYRQALEKWGEMQMIMVFEEMAELQKELCKSLRGKENRVEIAEEIADVEITLGQMKIFFGIEEGVDRYRKLKLQRLEERLRG